MEMIEADLCVIGGGAGGARVAAGVAKLGRKVVLVEKTEGGRGSLAIAAARALSAAGRAAHAQKSGAPFGVRPVSPWIDSASVIGHLREVVRAVTPPPLEQRFEGLPVQVLRGEGSFADQRSIKVGESRVRAKRFVIATGSRTVVPALPGFAGVHWFDDETIFSLDELPARLIVVGGSPTGFELAQAYCRLGAAVTVVETQRMLPQFDRALSQPVFDSLRRDGVALREGARVNAIEPVSQGVRMQITRVQGSETINGTHLLLTGNRVANIDALGLDKAQIAVEHGAIKVDRELRTSNPHVYAIGEAAGAPSYAHAARHHADRLVRSFQSRLSTHGRHDPVPEVLFTDPEIAQVGLKQSDAEARKLRYEVVTLALDETDTGRIERSTESFAKLIVGAKGRILGIALVAPRASEAILPWTLAIAEGMALTRLARAVAAYPTLGELTERASDAYEKSMVALRAKSKKGALARL